MKGRGNRKGETYKGHWKRKNIRFLKTWRNGRVRKGETCDCGVKKDVYNLVEYEGNVEAAGKLGREVKEEESYEWRKNERK